MKVLIAGAKGQLGGSLLRATPQQFEILACTDADLDVRDKEAIKRIVQGFRPNTIINAAAYTAVDKAETERELAFAVNANGAENLARTAREHKTRLIHISTDFVFDGKKSIPYLPQDEMRPVNVYGASKAEGERQVRSELGEDAVIIRTGWVYASEGRNFVNTMLRLMAEKESIDVVADQIGTPTWAMSLAAVVWKTVGTSEIKGTYHWSDAGVASWYDFAVAIEEEALASGLLERAIPIRPIATEEYPLPAKRPAYGVLDKHSLISAVGISPVHWRVQLRKMLEELRVHK